MMMQVAEHGYGDRLLVSHDIVMRHWLSKYGGWGVEHIMRSVVPLMMRKGMPRELVRNIMIDNPARILSLTAE